MRANRVRGVALLVSLAALLCVAALAGPAFVATSFAAARNAMRTVSYHGYRVTVPRSWPVFNLARAPHTCVRFNRHALYLGVPGAEQRCPAQAAGRTEAILIEPESASLAAAADRGVARPVGGAASTFIVGAARVIVTATWLQHRAFVTRALHRRALPRATAAAVAPRALPRSSGGGAPGPSSTYTGPGFDACDAPSAKAMAAWTSYSPYHAIGVYIGGANAACPPSADPNLTTTWLANEAAAGWHFIPTYVGLQAPSNGCGCAPIKASQATSEGTAAADDAVTQAQSLGMPSGTPIYDDMEYYSRTQSNTSAVLAFLAAWTTELHAKGYLAGVYGNANSAIADLVTQYGTSYPEPDDIWFAAWPGQGSQSTSDSNIPSTDWANHQRLHQYSGAHNETYGGVTINIDGDYLDGATAGAVTVGPPPPPTLSVAPSGYMTKLTTSWSGLGLTRWEVLAGTTPTALTGVKSAPLQGGRTLISVRSAAPYFGVEAVGNAGQVLASSAAVAAPARLALFGRSSFYGEGTGVGALPVGCYLATTCQISATIFAGRTRLTRTRTETFRAGGNGLLYYRLNATGRRMLAHARGARLPVQITLTDVSGATASAGMTLIPFTTRGRGPARGVTPNPLIGAAGTTDFIHSGSWGGVLARCGSVAACWTSATLSAGRVTIASAGAQLVGGLELGYVFFSPTAQGRRLLAAAPGNQLATTLVLRSGTSTATARIVLVQYS